MHENTITTKNSNLVTPASYQALLVTPASYQVTPASDPCCHFVAYTGMESSPQPDQPGEKEQEEKEQEEVEEEPLLVKRHVKYLQRVMGVLPYGAKSLDVNRCKGVWSTS